MNTTLWKQVLECGLEQVSFKLNAQQLKVFSHLSQCRTESAGVETYACSHCGYEIQLLRSCRDRHCPCCQYRATQKWCEARRDDVLPVTYHHLVFTLPSELNGWISCHGSVIYRLLFESVWHTLKKFGHDPKRLNGQLGMMGVLHTWGQTLVRHVHLHCMVPGGAITKDGDWHTARSNYLFPVKALSRHYRGRMISAQMRKCISSYLMKFVSSTAKIIERESKASIKSTRENQCQIRARLFHQPIIEKMVMCFISVMSLANNVKSAFLSWTSLERFR